MKVLRIIVKVIKTLIVVAVVAAAIYLLWAGIPSPVVEAPLSTALL